MTRARDDLGGIPDAAARAGRCASGARAAQAGRDLDQEIIGGRYARVDAAVAQAVSVTPPGGLTWTERVDRVLTHRVWGFAVFAVVMLLLFQALFTWSEPAIAAIEVQVNRVQDLVTGIMPDGPLRDLLVDGVIAGVGNVIVFVPQIAMLFLFIGVLEDLGYLARVAFVIDRLMGRVGLHGKSFVPMLSGLLVRGAGGAGDAHHREPDRSDADDDGAAAHLVQRAAADLRAGDRDGVQPVGAGVRRGRAPGPSRSSPCTSCR